MALLPQGAVFGVKNGSKSTWMATDAWLRALCSNKKKSFTQTETLLVSSI